MRGSGEEWWCVTGVDNARTIGARLRQVRRARGKSLRVVAGLAGVSTTHLWRIEHGERALDLSEIAALADALQIAPSELIKLPIPAPANGDTDSAIKAVRRALRAVGHGRPGGQVVPVETLRARVVVWPQRWKSEITSVLWLSRRSCTRNCTCTGVVRPCTGCITGGRCPGCGVAGTMR